MHDEDARFEELVNNWMDEYEQTKLPGETFNAWRRRQGELYVQKLSAEYADIQRAKITP